jgi:hypothetical protein
MLSLASPSLSQDATPESECGVAFKAADVIQDGVLTHTEIPKAQLPPELAKASLVGRQEFMATCVKTAQAKLTEKAATSPPQSPGLSVSPDTSGQQQPQGKTGPLDTKTGGAPAESPQGQTPPGMQSAPEGSSKTIVGPDPK